MPTNKKESLIFTTMMCAVMVLVMTFYNHLRLFGMSEGFIVNSLISFPLAYVVAFALDWFLVGPLAKKVAFKMITPEDSDLMKAIKISSCMIVGMVFFMSLFGALMGVGLSPELPIAWLINLPLNFIVALPLQLIIVGPLVRLVFSKVVKRAEVE